MATDTATAGGCGALGGGVSMGGTVASPGVVVDVLHQPSPFAALAANGDAAEDPEAMHERMKQQHLHLARGGRPPVSPAQTRAASPSPGRVQGRSSPSSGRPPVGRMKPQANMMSPDRLKPGARATVTVPGVLPSDLESSLAPRSSSVSEGRHRPLEESSQWNGSTVRFGAADDIGGRRNMEDRTISHLDIRAELRSAGHTDDLPTNRAFFGVLDGHDGVYAAAFASERLLGNVLREDAFATDIPEALRRGFLHTDQQYGVAVADGTCTDAGSTALASLVWGQTLYVANVGDCRAVLSRRGHAVQLSRDQDPSDCTEKRRVHDAGGYFCSDGRLCGQLTVTRCIGDWTLEWVDAGGTLDRLKLQDGTGPLTAEPEVTAHELQEEDEFMVMACDGLWGVFSNERAIELARLQLQDHNDPQACARKLVDEALKRHATDNISVVVICFSDTRPARRVSSSGVAMRKCVSSDAVHRLSELLGS